MSFSSFFYQPRTVPSFLQEFLGERTTVIDTILALGSALLFPFILSLLYPSDWASMTGWKFMLFCCAAGDIAAGAIGNTSPGTEEVHYRKSLASRHIFVFIHFIHLIGVGYPLIDALGVFEFLLITYGFMVVAAIAVLNAGRAQRPVSLMAIMIIIPFLCTVDCGREILRPVAMIFVLKLVLSYSVDHQRPVSFESIKSE
eukprot:Awhi_evm1s10727